MSAMFSTLHQHKKKTKASQPVKIKAKARANKYARYISYQCDFKRFIEVFNASI